MIDPLNPDGDDVNSIIGDRFDKALWDDVREGFQTVDDMVGDLKESYNYVEDFALDVFNLLAKGLPQLQDLNAMKATHKPLWSAVQSLTELTELQELRTFTSGDPFASATGMLSLREHLTTVLERVSNLEEQVKEAQEARQQAQDAAQNAQQAPDDPKAQEDAEEAAQVAAALQTALDDAIDLVQAGLRKGARQALKEAVDNAQADDQIQKSFGLGPSNLQRMSFKERADLAARLNSEKFRQFANLAGRFKQMAQAERQRRVKDVADEVIGVEFGDDLTRLTTQEQINLASPELEDDFWMRYANKELLVKKMQGRDREGRGAILCIVDESYSMNGAGELWAKALALALLNQAAQQKRDFHYIGFATGPLRQFKFPGGVINTGEAVELVEGFLGGGTDFSPPLEEAMQLIDVEDKKRPDVIFITDGHSSTPPFADSWALLKKRLDVTCYGIHIGGGTPSEALTAIADDVRTVEDLTDTQQVKDIIRQT